MFDGKITVFGQIGRAHHPSATQIEEFFITAGMKHLVSIGKSSRCGDTGQKEKVAKGQYSRLPRSVPSFRDNSRCLLYAGFPTLAQRAFCAADVRIFASADMVRFLVFAQRARCAAAIRSRLSADRARFWGAVVAILPRVADELPLRRCLA